MRVHGSALAVSLVVCYATHMSGSKRTWTDEQLIAAVVNAVSIAGVIRSIGLPINAGNYTTVNKYIKKLGLDISHFTGQRWVGTRDKHPNKTELVDILIEGSTYSTHHLKKRLIAEGLKQAVCEHCGLEEWMGVPIPLETDHINGVSNDHRITNLRLLCPNCHALTDTWKGRNIGKQKK